MHAYYCITIFLPPSTAPCVTDKKKKEEAPLLFKKRGGSMPSSSTFFFKARDWSIFIHAGRIIRPYRATAWVFNLFFPCPAPLTHQNKQATAPFSPLHANSPSHPTSIPHPSPPPPPPLPLFLSPPSPTLVFVLDHMPATRCDPWDIYKTQTMHGNMKKLTQKH